MSSHTKHPPETMAFDVPNIVGDMPDLTKIKLKSLRFPTVKDEFPKRADFRKKTADLPLKFTPHAPLIPADEMTFARIFIRNQPGC